MVVTQKDIDNVIPSAGTLDKNVNDCLKEIKIPQEHHAAIKKKVEELSINGILEPFISFNQIYEPLEGVTDGQKLTTILDELNNVSQALLTGIPEKTNQYIDDPNQLTNFIETLSTAKSEKEKEETLQTKLAGLTDNQMKKLFSVVMKDRVNSAVKPARGLVDNAFSEMDKIYSRVDFKNYPNFDKILDIKEARERPEKIKNIKEVKIRLEEGQRPNGQNNIEYLVGIIDNIKKGKNQDNQKIDELVYAAKQVIGTYSVVIGRKKSRELVNDLYKNYGKTRKKTAVKNFLVNVENHTRAKIQGKTVEAFVREQENIEKLKKLSPKKIAELKKVADEILLDIKNEKGKELTGKIIELGKEKQEKLKEYKKNLDKKIQEKLEKTKISDKNKLEKYKETLENWRNGKLESYKATLTETSKKIIEREIEKVPLKDDQIKLIKDNRLNGKKEKDAAMINFLVDNYNSKVLQDIELDKGSKIITKSTSAPNLTDLTTRKKRTSIIAKITRRKSAKTHVAKYKKKKKKEKGPLAPSF